MVLRGGSRIKNLENELPTIHERPEDWEGALDEWKPKLVTKYVNGGLGVLGRVMWACGGVECDKRKSGYLENGRG